MTDAAMIMRLGVLAAASRKSGRSTDKRRIETLGLLTSLAFAGRWRQSVQWTDARQLSVAIAVQHAALGLWIMGTYHARDVSPALAKTFELAHEASNP